MSANKVSPRISEDLRCLGLPCGMLIYIWRGHEINSSDCCINHCNVSCARYIELVHRLRDESVWQFTEHRGIASFLEAVAVPGAHTIKVGNQSLDLLIQNRGSRTTLIFFHSALTSNQPTVPVLQGRGIAESAGMNLISIADPSIELGDLDLAWYLGNRWLGHLRPLLSPVIAHALSSLGSEHTILFGSSGGGYAAVNFGNDFPDCTVLAINPRLDLSSRPKSAIPQYLQVCHDAHSSTPMLRIRQDFVNDRVSDQIGDRLRFNLLLFQNLGDTLYLNGQAKPFVEHFREDPRMFVQFMNHGDGHVAIPRETLMLILSALTSGESRLSQFLNAGFRSPGSSELSAAYNQGKLS